MRQQTLFFSFREALDMKQLLAQAEKTREQLRQLQDKTSSGYGRNCGAEQSPSGKKEDQKNVGRDLYLEKIRAVRRARIQLLEELFCQS